MFLCALSVPSDQRCPLEAPVGNSKGLCPRHAYWKWKAAKTRGFRNIVFTEPPPTISLVGIMLGSHGTTDSTGLRFCFLLSSAYCFLQVQKSCSLSISLDVVKHLYVSCFVVFEENIMKLSIFILSCAHVYAWLSLSFLLAAAVFFFCLFVFCVLVSLMRLSQALPLLLHIPLLARALGGFQGSWQCTTVVSVRFQYTHSISTHCALPPWSC